MESQQVSMSERADICRIIPDDINMPFLRTYPYRAGPMRCLGDAVAER